jgi:hypothetical protein
MNQGGLSVRASGQRSQRGIAAESGVGAYNRRFLGQLWRFQNRHVSHG